MAGLVQQWSVSLRQLVFAAADFADGGEWIADGSPTAAHWLADAAGVEACTTREWIRVGRCLRTLHASADAFQTGDLSYTKVRALTRFATPANEAELLDLARTAPASELNRLLAAWLTANTSPTELEAHQHRARSVTSRIEPDGMTTFSARLPPLQAATLAATIERRIMTARGAKEPDGTWPTVAQQSADALAAALSETTGGGVATEIVVHVRADGATLHNGTPIPNSVVERIAPHSFIRALIYDTNNKPIDATNRRRHPTTRQSSSPTNNTTADATTADDDSYSSTTTPHPSNKPATPKTTQLTLRCAPCHQRKTDREGRNARADSEARP